LIYSLFISKTVLFFLIEKTHRAHLKRPTGHAFEKTHRAHLKRPTGHI
jgi:hypothetical protein